MLPSEASTVGGTVTLKLREFVVNLPGGTDVCVLSCLPEG